VPTPTSRPTRKPAAAKCQRCFRAAPPSSARPRSGGFADTTGTAAAEAETAVDPSAKRARGQVVSAWNALAFLSE
jgi:hypothetical protein